MKNKILSFMLALIFVIPCLFTLAACGEKPCAHEELTHGLCSCGEYQGVTLTLGESQTNLEYAKDEKGYFRYQVEEGSHYQRTGSNIPAADIKYYAQYNNNWVELNNYKIISAQPQAGYVYIEITASAVTTNASIKVEEVAHSVDGTIDGSETSKTMDLGSYAAGKIVCAAITLVKGYVYEFDVDTPNDDYDCAEVQGVYTANGAVATTTSAGKVVLDLTNAAENFSGYVHIYINSQDASNVINVTRVQA